LHGALRLARARPALDWRGDATVGRVTPDELKARVRAQYGEGIPATSYRDGRTPSEKSPTISDRTGPITLRIPWSALVSDNVKSRAARRGEKATVVLTPEYREARDRIKVLAADVMAGRPPYAVPLSFTARVWVPNHHRRDVVNFSKALQDAMNAVVYEDDCWLYETHWIRAGVDVDAPRCEVVIAPLAA
jgi:Holliday junction resolvase RusA-like endonuclease